MTSAEILEENRPENPGIFLSTIPKSGSVYLWQAISGGLGRPMCRASALYWPEDRLLHPRFGFDNLTRVAAGKCVAHAHLDASRQNMLILNRYLDRIWVHVRDPRMATLEWAHHLLGLRETGLLDLQDCSDPALPEDYFSMPWRAQICYCVDHHLPACIRWLESWLDARQTDWFKTKILFTRYEDMVADEDAFWARILDFYGIDPSRFAFKPFRPKPNEDPKLEGEYHFRNARTDEWRDVFTPHQRNKACGMMPERLLAVFDWPEQ